MKKVTLFATGITMMSCAQQQKLTYPETAKVDTVDVYFGTEVPDPYRWLENDTSAATAAWVEAQNKVTNGYLSKIPFRDALLKRLTDVAIMKRLVHHSRNTASIISIRMMVCRIRAYCMYRIAWTVNHVYSSILTNSRTMVQ